MREVCFAKCYVLTFEQEEDFALPEWGNEDEVFNIRLISKKELDRPMSTRWIKKKADRDCLSDDPKDCLVWCEVKVPATYQITKDYIDETPEDFSTEAFFKTRFENLTGSLEWHPVLCKELIDEKIIQAIVKELKYENYLAQNAVVELNENTWKALHKFQVDFKLPVGNLNLATLDFMNLEY